jgi:hypothetical protein
VGFYFEMSVGVVFFYGPVGYFAGKFYNVSVGVERFSGGFRIAQVVYSATLLYFP